MHAEFFLVGTKAKCDKGGRRLLLGNSTGSRAVMLWLIRFHCVGVGFQLYRFVHTYSVDHMYTGCPRRNGQNFKRVFLMLKYTDITQNTYIQS